MPKSSPQYIYIYIYMCVCVCVCVYLYIRTVKWATVLHEANHKHQGSNTYVYNKGLCVGTCTYVNIRTITSSNTEGNKIG
jgi:hypothetical protein